METPLDNQETALTQVIQQIRELTADIAGGLLTESGEDLASALANLDMLLIKHHQKRALAGGSVSEVVATSPQAVDRLREFLQDSGIEWLSHQEGLLHLRLGKEYRQTGRWNEALQQYQKAVAIAENEGNVRLEADCYKEIGHLYSERNVWQEASAAYEQANTLYRHLGDEDAEGEIIKNLAINSFYTGNYERAIEHGTRVLDIAERLGNLQLEADIHNLLAAIHDARGDLDQALTYYQRCLMYYEQLNDPAGLAQTYHNLGLTYTRRREWQSAGDAYERCLQLAQKYGKFQLLGSVCLNRAELYFNLHDSVMSKAYCQEAIQVFETLQFRRGLANAYRLLGRLQSQEGVYDDAERFFRVALRLSKSIQDVQTQAEIYEAWAETKLLINDSAEARVLLQQSLELYDQLQATESTRRIQEALGQLSA